MNYTDVKVARALLALTASEVQATEWKTEQSSNGAVAVDLRFTMAAAETCTIRFYGSHDGTTYVKVADDTVGLSETLTVSTDKAYRFSSLPGLRFFRCSVQGTGTNSTAAIYYRWFKKGSQR